VTKRVLSMVLLLCLLLTTVPTAALAAGRFTDVEEGSWYAEAVQYVYENGLMNGTSATAFSPDGTATRAMMVTILYRLDGSPAVSGSMPFADVPAGSYYEQAALWASQNKIVTGTSATTFAPSQPVTREQMVTFLYRYAGHCGFGQENSVSLADYTDAGQVSTWAQDALKWSVAEGIVGGVTATLLAPARTTTRSQLATVLMRFCRTWEAEQAFRAKNADDFVGDEVILLEESTETNFAVLTEDAVAPSAAGMQNRLVSADEENGVYTFENISSEVSALQPGDVFYRVYGAGEEDYVLLKVAQITVSGRRAVITAAEAELAELFQYIDLDLQMHLEEDAVTQLNRADEVRPLEVLSGSIRFSVEKELSSGATLSAELDGTVKVDLRLKHENRRGKDYTFIRLAVEDQLSISASYQVETGEGKDTYREVMLSLLAPVGSTGVFLDGDLFFEFDVNGKADLTLESEIKSTQGFQYDTDNGWKSIYESESEDKLAVNGSFDVTVGMGMDLGVSFMKICKVSATGSAGLELSGKSQLAGISSDQSEKHLCALCVDGDISAVAKLGFKVKIGVNDKLSITPVDVSAKVLKIKLTDFYVSLLGGEQDLEFAKGECPHKEYRMVVTVADQNANPLGGAAVEVTDADGLVAGAGTTDPYGHFTYYYPKGTYSVFAYGLEGYQNGTASVTVADGKAAVCVTMQKEGPATYYVDTVEELRDAIGSNRRIVLAEGEYLVNWIQLWDLNDLVLEGQGTVQLLSEDWDDDILYITNCENVTLKNLYIGHVKELENSCYAGVLYLQNSSGIAIEHCEIYGCGLTGIAAYDCQGLTVTGTVIRDCAWSSVWLNRTDAAFTGCQFLRNGYMTDWGYPNLSFYQAKVTFTNCTFRNNYNDTFVSADQNSTYTTTGCTFRGNAW